MAITATLGTACMTLISSVQHAWTQHNVEMAAREQMLAALAHIVRNARQATAVAGMEPGVLQLAVEEGNAGVKVRSWRHDADLGQLIYEDEAGSEVLAERVAAFGVEWMESDCVTYADDPSEARYLVPALTYEVPRIGAVSEGVSFVEVLMTRVGLRSW